MCSPGAGEQARGERAADYYRLLGFADYVVAADEAFRLNDAGVHADIVPVGPATSSVH